MAPIRTTAEITSNPHLKSSSLIHASLMAVIGCTNTSLKNETILWIDLQSRYLIIIKKNSGVMNWKSSADLREIDLLIFTPSFLSLLRGLNILFVNHSAPGKCWLGGQQIIISSISLTIRTMDIEGRYIRLTRPNLSMRVSDTSVMPLISFRFNIAWFPSYILKQQR